MVFVPERSKVRYCYCLLFWMFWETMFVSRAVTAVGRHVENVSLRKFQALKKVGKEKLKSFLRDITRLRLYSGPSVRKCITLGWRVFAESKFLVEIKKRLIGKMFIIFS